MLTYIFIGLALGSIYALAAASLVITYESAGILNFAFGSMAFFVAKFFYWANQTHRWNLGVAAVVTLGVVAPALGVALYLIVFRFLRTRSTLIKLVSSIGVSVALPAVAIMLFGNQAITQAPGLAPIPVKFWHVFGATLTLDQVIIYAFLAVVVVAGTLILRFTDAGLKVRAVVNSEALTSLSGVNPNRVALGVWAVSGLLAGAAGVMAGPTISVSIDSMTLLMASAFAAVVAARLRNVGAAVVIALLMGVITDLLQYWLPDNSTTSTDIVQSVPFVIILLFLLYYLVRGGALGQEMSGGSALDAAIKPEGGEGAVAAAKLGALAQRLRWYSPRSVASLAPLAFLLFLPLIFDGYWLGLTARGIALAVILLSFSLVTGDGGMIWLCQITFAGGGALIAAKLWLDQGMDPIVAALIGAVIMVPIGVLIGALTIRLGELYVALVTLSFGLLVDKVIFSRTEFLPGQGGVQMARPGFAVDDRAFAYFALAVFLVVGAFIVNLRRSSSGMAISAIRWSEPAARTLGLKVVRVKLVLSGLAALVAGLGGALLSMYDLSTDPVTYGTFNGLIWLAVLVTVGVRSLTAALLAGLSFMLVPALFSTYLTGATWLQVPSVLFGLGAIGLATHPEGVVAMYARQLQDLVFGRILGRFTRGTPAVAAPLADVDVEDVLRPGYDSAGPQVATAAAGTDGR
ncbi:MAG TPA: ABC transporter permease [Jatrophihabitantaceae bacterium]|jgi:branched-chain amino acid transport system permease protein